LKQVEVYVIDEKRFMRLQFEDPSFGLAIMRTITRRLMRDLQEATDAGVTVKPSK
jgi:CRP-like cAMP-binding protein